MPLAMEVFSDDRPWAITPRGIRALVRAAHHPDFEAVAARLGQPIDGGRYVANHDGTAVLDIRGPLFRYRSIWTWLLGGSAIEDLSLGLSAALDDSAVHAIVLAINSPGGQIDGINEFANMIRAANATKPVTAYVDGLAASGAYWLAAAAGKIVADETAQLGSIGVLATVVDDRGADEKRGVKRFDVVSSQSPLKRTDPATDEGRDQLQQMVDALAQVFIAKVAQFRGTSEGRVERDFGQGAVLPARQAVATGMADTLGSLEGLLGREGAGEVIRQVRDKPGIRVAVAAPVAQLDDDEEEEQEGECNCPPGEPCHCQQDDEEQENEARASVPIGVDLMTPTEDRQRIAAILTCEEARGREELARVLALETDHSLDAAKKLLLAAPTASQANALDARMSRIPNPQVGVPADAQQDDSPAAEVARILAYVPKERKRLHVQ